MKKQECPFCHKKFTGSDPDTGKSFFDQHTENCEFRTPPNANSLPIQEKITECLKCSNKDFREGVKYDNWNPRQVLWEYVCKKCGQMHTSLSSRQLIASDVPYKTKLKKENK